MPTVYPFKKQVYWAFSDYTWDTANKKIRAYTNYPNVTQYHVAVLAKINYPDTLTVNVYDCEDNLLWSYTHTQTDSTTFAVLRHTIKTTSNCAYFTKTGTGQVYMSIFPIIGQLETMERYVTPNNNGNYYRIGYGKLSYTTKISGTTSSLYIYQIPVINGIWVSCDNAVCEKTGMIHLHLPIFNENLQLTTTTPFMRTMNIGFEVTG